MQYDLETLWVVQTATWVVARSCSLCHEREGAMFCCRIHLRS